MFALARCCSLLFALAFSRLLSLALACSYSLLLALACSYLLLFALARSCSLSHNYTFGRSQNCFKPLLDALNTFNTHLTVLQRFTHDVGRSQNLFKHLLDALNTVKRMFNDLLQCFTHVPLPNSRHTHTLTLLDARKTCSNICWTL